MRHRLHLLALPLMLLGPAACERTGSATPRDGGATAESPATAKGRGHGHGEGHGHHDAEGHGHGHGHGAAGPAPGHRHTGGHHRFDDPDEWAKVFDDPERDAWQRPDDVIAWMKLAPGDTVADLGAGTGYFAVRLARAVPEGAVLAQDVEASMVAYLGERAKKEKLGNIRPIQGAPDDPALPGPVDAVLLVDVYHHIADRPAFFRKVRAALSAKGRVVIVDFKPDAPEDAPGPPKAMRVSPEQVTSELAEAGLVVARRSDDLLPYQYVIEVRPGS